MCSFSQMPMPHAAFANEASITGTLPKNHWGEGESKGHFQHHKRFEPLNFSAHYTHHTNIPMHIKFGNSHRYPQTNFFQHCLFPRYATFGVDKSFC